MGNTCTVHTVSRYLLDSDWSQMGQWVTRQRPMAAALIIIKHRFNYDHDHDHSLSSSLLNWEISLPEMRDVQMYFANFVLIFFISEAESTDPDAICPQRPIDCIECRSSENKLCADPMNSTVVKKMTKEKCDGFCVKWVRKPKELPGFKEYIRTCSRKLIFHIQINMVCIRESRSGNGFMCFCNKENCNRVPSLKATDFSLLVFALLPIVFNGL